MYLKLSLSFHSFLFLSLGTRSKKFFSRSKKILQRKRRRRREDEKPHGQDEPAPAN
jgi:hypothetical protein